MSKLSVNSFIKEIVDDESIGVDVSEDLTDASDTKDNLDAENDLTNESSYQVDIVTEKINV